MNDCLLQMKPYEKRKRGFEYSEDFEKENFDDLMILTDKWKAIKEKERQDKVEQEKKIIESEEMENRHKSIEEKLSKEEIMLIEKDTGRYVESVLFDSDIHQWGLNTTDFSTRILNQSHFYIIIETTDENKFGCYIDSVIPEQGVYVSDSKAFLFKFKDNSIQKYPIIDSTYAFRLNSERGDGLFIVGRNDIVIKRKERTRRSNCQQTSYNYYSKENELLGRSGPFEVKHILVIGTVGENEMNERISKKRKEIHHEEKKQKHQIMKTKRNQIRYNSYGMDCFSFREMMVLEKFTGLKIDDILFDSKIDNWSNHRSVFNERIIGKKQLIFLIVDEDGEKFGYYLNTQIEEEYYLPKETDNKSFQFNIQSNGRLEKSIKCKIKDTEYGSYNLSERNKLCLIRIGNIYLYKQEKKEYSYCWYKDKAFNYHKKKTALCGKKENTLGCVVFIPKRILIIQMINKK